MADELAVAETTASEETQAQTPATEAPVTEAAATPAAPETAPEPDRGDPRVAMQEERRRRQDLEARLNDQNFIYERAKALGLAQDETPASAPSPQTPTAATQGQPDVASIVEHQLDYLRTVEKYPEFDRDKGDQALVKWAATLVNDGHRPSEAVDIIRKTISKQAAKASAEQVDKTLEGRAASEAAKLNAAAITSTAPATSDSRTEELRAQARNWKNPEAQQEALLQLEIIKEREKAGIR